jgi:hypothetical protein
MWASCHVHHVHSMHASSGLPDNLKSHAVGHPWSSHMCVELVSIHMHNEQLLGFCSRRSIVCVRCLLTTVGLPGLQHLGPNTHSPAYSVHRRCQSWLVRGLPDWEDGTILSQLLAIDLHAHAHAPHGHLEGSKTCKPLFAVVGATRRLSSCPTQLGQRDSELLHFTLRSSFLELENQWSRQRVGLVGSAQMPLTPSEMPWKLRAK